MDEISERDIQEIVGGIPSSNLVLFCPGLQGHGLTLIDRSQSANTCAITGATWARTKAGLSVLSFGGADHNVNCGSATVLDNLGRVDPYTFFGFAWINPTSLGESNFGRIFDKVDATPAGFLLGLYSTTSLRFGVYKSTAFKSTITDASSITLSAWQFVAFLYNGAKIYACINTTWTTGTDVSGAIDAHASASLLIGDRSASTACFNGKMGMWCVGTGAPSTSAFASIYNHTKKWFK